MKELQASGVKVDDRIQEGGAEGNEDEGGRGEDYRTGAADSPRFIRD